MMAQFGVTQMIDLTMKEQGKPICMNKAHIVFVEDTVNGCIIHLANGYSMDVRDSYLDVVGRLKAM